MLPDWLLQLLTPEVIAIALVVTVCVLIYLIRKFAPKARRLSHILDDVFGEPARDGVPERPGIMKRLELLTEALELHSESLTRIEATQAEHAEKLQEVNHEVRYNHGSSLKDATRRTEEEVKGIKSDISDIKTLILLRAVDPAAASAATASITLPAETPAADAA